MLVLDGLGLYLFLDSSQFSLLTFFTFSKPPLVLSYPLEDCYADTYQEDVPGDDNHPIVPSLLTGALYISQPAGSV